MGGVSDGPPLTTIFVRRGFAALGAACCAVVVGVCVLLLLLATDPVGVTLGVVVGAAFSSLLLVSLRRAFSSQPALRFTEDGIDDPLWLFGFRRLPWRDVEAVLVTDSDVLIQTFAAHPATVRFIPFPVRGRSRCTFQARRFLLQRSELAAEGWASRALSAH